MNLNVIKTLPYPDCSIKFKKSESKSLYEETH